MRLIKTMAIAAIASIGILSCQKEKGQFDAPENDDNIIKEETDGGSLQRDNHHDGNNGKGFVYTLSNQANENKVIAYRRAANGALTYAASFETGGNGSGGGLGNQGAVILADEGKFLLAVNAGSNTISSFRVKNNGLDLRCTVNSGGVQPVSITQFGNLVYVLNSGGNGNISGFRLNDNGTLSQLSNSTRPLSSSTAGAAQISFTNNGKVLVITEKATNKIITYRINQWGRPWAMHSITSANTTPFGFAAGTNGNIFVSEAAGGAPGASTLSSYHVSNNGNISLIQGPVGAGQAAACWVVLTGNGKFAYATNTASNNISTFKLNPWTGTISVSQAISATTQAGPIDAAISDNSKFLYVLNGGGHSIQAFTVAHDGSLSNLQTVPGLPASANGLAAD